MIDSMTKRDVIRYLLNKNVRTIPKYYRKAYKDNLMDKSEDDLKKILREHIPTAQTQLASS